MKVTGGIATASTALVSTVALRVRLGRADEAAFV
jgi:hypothetical protein